MVLFVVAALGFQPAGWDDRAGRSAGRQILNVMRREILNGDGALGHGLLLGQQIGAGWNEIVRRQTRLTDEMVDGRWWWWSRKFLRRKRRDGRRRRLVVAVVGQYLRRRVNVDGRVRQIRAGQRRATERCRLGWRPVRRWRSESRCRIHRRLPIMLLLCMWRWRRDVLRLGWQQRQPDRVVRRINVPDPVGRQVFRRIKNGFQDQKFVALLLTDQGQCVDVLFELHPGIFCRKRMTKTNGKHVVNKRNTIGCPTRLCKGKNGGYREQ